MELRVVFHEVLNVSLSLLHIAHYFSHLPNLLVIGALLEGPRRFGELQEAVPGLATNVLAARLRELERHGLGGVTGVDTRRLTRHIREAGAMTCAMGQGRVDELLVAAKAEPGTVGVDLVGEVTVAEPYHVEGGPFRVVAYDFGMKRTILSNLAKVASIEVVPAGTPADEVLAREPDGVFLSNGPGDPAALGHLVEAVRGLLGAVPVFGICLGHQLLAEALGGTTYKLAFGHHGANHPVKRLSGESVEVTSQNHGYAVAEEGLAGATVTHRSLNDGVVEGMACTNVPAFSVQYHPEAGPGPHDAWYLFEEFRQLMERCRGRSRA